MRTRLHKTGSLPAAQWSASDYEQGIVGWLSGLWGLKKYHGLDLEAAEDVPISAFPHKRDYKAVTVTTSMDQLIEAAMNQNFVPVVDDRGIFIGIVRRQAIIRYCYEKSREEKAPQPGRVVPEYAAAH